MRIVTISTAGAAALLISACVSRGAPEGPATLVEAPGEAAPPQARFYAQCIYQAAGSGSYDREGTTLRFRCTGEPARAFYEGLGSWSARAGSERSGEGRTWRFTSPMARDPSGLDFCTRDAAGDHRCTVVLRVGEFLAFRP